MQILRWLFVHPILFAWILAFLAILLNWGVGGRSHEGDMKGKGQQVAEHSQPAAEAGQGAVAEAAQAEAKTEATAETVAPATATAEQAEAPTQKEAAAEATTSAGGGEAAAVAVAAGVVAVAATEVVSASVAEQANVAGAATERAPAQEATVAAGTSEDLLLAAREAYWSGELDRSVEFYQSLLAKDRQPDYKGELANVFWKQGKSTEAVALYSEIAPWLAEQGRTAELNSMKVYAALVSPEKAAEIGAFIK